MNVPPLFSQWYWTICSSELSVEVIPSQRWDGLSGLTSISIAHILGRLVCTAMPSKYGVSR